jgi:hypothetical protein
MFSMCTVGTVDHLSAPDVRNFTHLQLELLHWCWSLVSQLLHWCLSLVSQLLHWYWSLVSQLLHWCWSLVSQFLVVFLQLCVDWNACCAFSEGAIRNYQMVCSLGGLRWLGLRISVLWRRTIGTLKKFHCSHSALHSQCVGSNLMCFR